MTRGADRRAAAPFAATLTDLSIRAVTVAKRPAIAMPFLRARVLGHGMRARSAIEGMS